MAKMTVRVDDKNGVKLISVVGSITLGSGDTTVREVIKDLIANGHKKLLIDLGEVGFMDSTGLGELVAAYSSARSQKADLKLCNLTKKIDDLMEITQLASVFETYESLEEALGSFA